MVPNWNESALNLVRDFFILDLLHPRWMSLRRCHKSQGLTCSLFLVLEWYKVCECYLVHIFNVFQLLTPRFAQQNLCCINKSTMNHWENLPIENETSLELITVSKVHVCCFLKWIHKFSQLCSILNVEQLIKFEDKVRFLLNMWLYGVFSLILAYPHNNQQM